MGGAAEMVGGSVANQAQDASLRIDECGDIAVSPAGISLPVLPSDDAAKTLEALKVRPVAFRRRSAWLSNDAASGLPALHEPHVPPHEDDTVRAAASHEHRAVNRPCAVHYS